MSDSSSKPPPISAAPMSTPNSEATESPPPVEPEAEVVVGDQKEEEQEEIEEKEKEEEQEEIEEKEKEEEQEEIEEKEKEQEQEEEEEGECGFCLYMKAGGCRDAFIDWEKCIEEAEKNKEDLVEKCANITAALKLCMDSHSDYYGPILRAEKAAEKQAIEELEKEKEAQEQQAEVVVPNDGASSASKDEN